ncbi:MAG: hypothetical protein J3R72DRAFT_25662 [Linnemannia gamsii]|nr:MAG: hypothetical protein J3R72DRAFT_25662 [Linnemannia gamsii]
MFLPPGPTTYRVALTLLPLQSFSRTFPSFLFDIVILSYYDITSARVFLTLFASFLHSLLLPSLPLLTPPSLLFSLDPASLPPSHSHSHSGSGVLASIQQTTISNKKQHQQQQPKKYDYSDYISLLSPLHAHTSPSPPLPFSPTRFPHNNPFFTLSLTFLLHSNPPKLPPCPSFFPFWFLQPHTIHPSLSYQAPVFSFPFLFLFFPFSFSFPTPFFLVRGVQREGRKGQPLIFCMVNKKDTQRAVQREHRYYYSAWEIIVQGKTTEAIATTQHQGPTLHC